jgi:hypothetical protein
VEQTYSLGVPVPEMHRRELVAVVLGCDPAPSVEGARPRGDRSSNEAGPVGVVRPRTFDPHAIADQPRGSRAWRRFVPWQGPATRVDRALMGAILGVVALGLLVRPLKPFLLASHPAALEFLTGDLTAIGAAAAFARLGELPLWLVIVAGAGGMVKFDWLTWWPDGSGAGASSRCSRRASARSASPAGPPR